MHKNPYIPHSEKDIKEMLKQIGVSSIDDLFSDLPKQKNSSMNIPDSSDEYSVFRNLNTLARRNTSLNDMAVFRGGGVYYHLIPSVVYALATRHEFLTAYTPYQAEVSQGTLQLLFEFQTMISELTGLEVANSSMYDGASALAEAALMSVKITGKRKVLLSESIHPEYRDVTNTYCFGQNIEVKTFGYDKESGQIDLKKLESMLSDEISAVAVGYPNFFGVVEDLKILKEALPDGVLLIAVVNPMALPILEAPGNLGADIAVGEGQPLGNLPNMGGPGFGLFAARKEFIRKMPGRIIGETVDQDGNTAYAMILQTREQHIRRDKATSNICSNQAFNALVASIYMSVMGREGLVEVSRRCFDRAHYIHERTKTMDGLHPVFTGPFFNEFVVRFDDALDKINDGLLEQKILGPLNVSKFYPELKNCGLLCATEAVPYEDIEFFVARLEEML